MDLKRPRPVCLLLGFTLCLGGCPFDRYQIEMSSQNGELTRTLTVSHVEGVKPEEGRPPRVELGTFDAEKLAALQKLYPRRVETDREGLHRFQGVFRERTPADVGGAGFHQHFTTSLGSMTIYTERFRGDDDLAGQIAAAHGAVDQTVELLIGWFETEMADEPRLGALREFMDTKLRADLKNMATYIWAFHLARRDVHKEKAELLAVEMIIRYLHYLAERGYLTGEEVPRWVRLLLTEEQRHSKGDAVMGRIQRLVADRMGLGADEPIPASLAFLADYETTAASAMHYLATTPEHTQKLAQWRETHDPNDTDASPPEPLDVLVNLAMETPSLTIEGDGDDRVEVAFHLNAPPIWTNGRWDAKKKHVAWSTTLGDAAGAPPLLYVIWSVPDQTFQVEHFGKVLLSHEELLEYCLWHAGLSRAEGKQWDALLNGLKPGDSAMETLRVFRFEHELPARQGQNGQAESQESYASQTVQMLLEAADPNDPS